VARREIVRDDDSRFATVAEDLSSTPLPAAGSATRIGGGVLTRIALPLTELYGAPVAGGILYSLDISLLHGDDESRLGLAQIRLTLDEIRDSRDRTIELVGWVPLEGTGDVAVRITELPSRRQLAVVPEGRGREQTVLEVSRELCLTELMLGQGTLYAFFGTDEASRAPVARLHIGERRPGTTNVVPGSPLWIERVATEESSR